MDKNSNSYVVLFAVAICVACSAALALTFNGLKGAIDANAEFDRSRNVLKAVGYWDPTGQSTDPEVLGPGADRGDLEQRFEESIKRIVVRRESGEEIEDPSTEDVLKQLKADGKIRDLRQRQLLELYRAERNGETRYVLPTLQYGLWSWMEGFLAVDEKGEEVIGITYYKDGETPGLGGEVNNIAWQEQWQGKELFDERGELVSVTVKKGKVDPDSPVEQAHYVDGLSGATITSDGVTRDMKKNVEAYQPFFDRIRKGN